MRWGNNAKQLLISTFLLFFGMSSLQADNDSFSRTDCVTVDMYSKQLEQNLTEYINELYKENEEVDKYKAPYDLKEIFFHFRLKQKVSRDKFLGYVKSWTEYTASESTLWENGCIRWIDSWQGIYTTTFDSLTLEAIKRNYKSSEHINFVELKNQYDEIEESFKEGYEEHCEGRDCAEDGVYGVVFNPVRFKESPSIKEIKQVFSIEDKAHLVADGEKALKKLLKKSYMKFVKKSLYKKFTSLLDEAGAAEEILNVYYLHYDNYTDQDHYLIVEDQYHQVFAFSNHFEMD